MTPVPVFRSVGLWASLLAVVLAYNSMFMMLAPTHVASIDEIAVVEGVNNGMAVENCGGVHCNFIVDAAIDVPAFYFKETQDSGLLIDVVDISPAPLKKPPRYSLV